MNLSGTTTRANALAYKALVRPHLEYCNSVWDPHTAVLSSKLDAVQRRAARFVLNDYSSYSSVTDMLIKLDWPTLKSRRTQERLVYVMMHKITTDKVAIPAEDYMQPLTTSS